jgi:hypothetical protein
MYTWALSVLGRGDEVPTTRRFTPDEKIEMQQRYQGGENLDLIAKAMHTSAYAVKDVLREGGIALRTPPRPGVTDEQRDVILRRYQEGASYKSITRELGIGNRKLQAVLLESGPGPRPRSKARFSKQEAQEVVARFLAGESMAALARSYGTSRYPVVQAIKKAGLQPGPRGNRNQSFTPEQIQEMATRWYAGESQTTIGYSMGLTQSAVSRALLRAGIKPHKWTPSGKQHHSWKGGRVRDVHGYWQIRLLPDDPLFVMANSSGYAMEHRIVMARKLGRSLKPGETVHHIDGDKSHNEEDNLELRQGKHGKGVRYRCRCCGSYDVEEVPLNAITD